LICRAELPAKFAAIAVDDWKPRPLGRRVRVKITPDCGGIKKSMRIALCVLLLSLCCGAEDKNRPEWQTGTLIDQSVTLEDAGCAGNVCGGTYHRTHYTIAAGSKLYVANRTGSRLNISVNAPVKFAISGNTVYLMDERGKSHDCHLEQVRDAAKTSATDGAQGSVTAAEADALITLVSTPEGGDINIDDAFVGNAPAKLKLKPGKHTIKVTKTGYKDWARDMTVLAGSEVTLTATLEKLN
jgi:hypothetical protein